MEEYESDEKVEFVMDDDDEMALYMAMMQDEDSSRRCPPPKVIGPCDHCAGDNYFFDNPVYIDPMFCRRFFYQTHIVD
jgi:hypothetical protein